MRLGKYNILSCLLILFLSITLGCSKKGDEGTAASTAGAGAVSVDTQKPIAEVQAQAETMTVDSLKATAIKYKEAILAKQAELQKLAAKLKEIPITEALGEEAKALKTDLQSVEASLKALKDRFQVYYDTLKKKGGDVSGLML